jgi:hypothetical protein
MVAQAPKPCSLRRKSKTGKRLTNIFLFKLASQMALSMDERISPVLQMRLVPRIHRSGDRMDDGSTDLDKSGFSSSTVTD